MIILWPLVCRWGISSTSNISTAFVKKGSSEQVLILAPNILLEHKMLESLIGTSEDRERRGSLVPTVPLSGHASNAGESFSIRGGH